MSPVISSRRLNLMELEAIAEALKTNASLMEIDLRMNNIGDEGAEACCVVLRSLFHVSCVLQVLYPLNVFEVRHVQLFPQLGTMSSKHAKTSCRDHSFHTALASFVELFTLTGVSWLNDLHYLTVRWSACRRCGKCRKRRGTWVLKSSS